MAVKFKSAFRQRHYDYLIGKGFFPQEAMRLSRTSRSGMAAPYFQAMIRSRKRTLDNAKKYDWSQSQFQDHIQQQYRKLNIALDDPFKIWKLLRYYEERARQRGQEHDSPWEKRIRSKKGKRIEAKHTSRKSVLENWIFQLDNKIDKTKSDYRREQLVNQRDNLQRELNKYAED